VTAASPPPENVTPRRYNMTVSISESATTARQAAAFLRSDAGRAAVHRRLRSVRLPRVLADDVIQDVLGRVCAAAAQGVAINNVEAFVTQLVHRSAVDIVRGRVRRPQVVDLRGVDLDAGVQGGRRVPASPLDVEADALVGESLAAVRRALHQGLGADPASGAAALAYLAVTVDGAEPGRGCPQPAGGATPAEAAEWVALWYAGRRRCFPTEGATSPATVRKRRSRLTRRFRDLLIDAAESSGLDREGARRA
jgi:DNA-directed RNA polymerase specialized sigma24 family protein